MVQVVYGVALFGGIFYCGLEWSWPQILLDANDVPSWRQIIKNWKCAKLSTVSKYLVLDA